MALRGLIQQDGCADVFQLLGRQNKTGLLKLRNPPNAVDIWIHQGMVMRVEDRTRNPRERLGELLVRAGLLSRQNLKEALATQRTTRKRMGHVLLEGRYVPQQVLADFIKLQTRETLFNAFLMRKGTYEFVADATTTPAPELGGGLRWEHAVMEGVRRASEWPGVRAVIPTNLHSFKVLRSLDEPPASKPAPPADEGGLSLGDDEFDTGGPTFPSEQDRLVFALVRPVATVQRIVDQSYLGEFETCAILARLVKEGYLETTEPTLHGDDELDVDLDDVEQG